MIWISLTQGTAIRDRIQERLRGQSSLLINGKDDLDDVDEEYYDEDDDDEEEYYDDEEYYDEEDERNQKLKAKK